jgi:hypothetical protein
LNGRDVTREMKQQTDERDNESVADIMSFHETQLDTVVDLIPIWILIGQLDNNSTQLDDKEFVIDAQLLAWPRETDESTVDAK